MRETMLEMMAALAAAAVTSNQTADELVEAADVLDGEPVADAMRGLARRHRVEALKLQGRLAGLTNDFVERFGAI